MSYRHSILVCAVIREYNGKAANETATMRKNKPLRKYISETISFKPKL